jgi:Ca2+-binding RTX toxin-like protein
VAYDLKGYRTINGTTGDDSLGGGTRNEAIYGNGGTDTLSGGAGSDVLFGSGTFLYSVDGTWSSGSYAYNAGDPLAAGTGEVISIGGYGRSYDVFVGSGSNNTLVMGDGHNALFLDDPLSPGVDHVRLHGIQTIVGGSGGQVIDLTSSRASLGPVTVLGGSGNDHIWSSSGSDTISGGGGNDNIWGGSGDDRMTGDAGSDTIAGGTGNDFLDGGLDADIMRGGAGDDTYVVDNSADQVIEAADQGIDEVRSSFSYALGASVENLVLTAGGAIDAAGNDLANNITGGSGDNVIAGGSGNDTLNGGAGNDTIDGGVGDDLMIGGLGNDFYIVDAAGDVVSELAGGGTDTVSTGISHTLAANVENLVLTGTAAINGNGNTLANAVTGNEAANRIDTGFGNDTIQSGGGNDYINAGGDFDLVHAGDGNDGVFAGGANDTIFGGAGNDTIYGDGSNDVIWGGAGNDMLVGGQFKNGYSAGNDTFAWLRGDAVNGDGSSAGFDRITDFGAGDRMDFSGMNLGTAVPRNYLVRATDTASGTVISASFDNGATFLDVVLIEGQHGLDVDALLASGALIV